MQYRRVVCLILGLWLGGSLVMAWFGARSFQTPERLLNESNPGFILQTRPMGHAATRAVLRHAVADQNRWLFQSWELMQIGIGVLLFTYLLFGTMEGKFTLLLSLLMLILVAVQRIAISPTLGSLGNTLDYMSADTVVSERAKFWMLHSAYIGVELGKLGLGLIVCALVLRRSRSVDPLNQFDMIDKANHRHVNW
jgi:hypothetical protein